MAGRKPNGPTGSNGKPPITPLNTLPNVYDMDSVDSTGRNLDQTSQPSSQSSKSKIKLSTAKTSAGRGRDLTIATSTIDEQAESRATAKKRRSDDKFLKESYQVFKSIAEDTNEVEIREKALEELRFKEGDQWPVGIAEIRRAKRRPMVTINKVKPAVRIICNDQRQNRSSIRVAPVDSGSDRNTAEILQGIVRHIEVNSMSDIAVDNACEGQVTFGFGYIRIKVDYASPYSMDQEIYISRIKDAFSVYYGACSEPDYSDANDCFITEDLDPVAYEQRFPDSMFASLNDFSGIGDTHKGWGTRDKIRICERFYRTFEKKTLCRMSDGSSMLKEKIPDELLENNDLGIVEERETEIPVVHWKLFNAREILQEREWNGMFIPIIPVLGDDTIIDGKRVMSGVVRGAMDPNRQYNYFRSLMTETIGLAPKAPYVMAEGQNEGHQTMWDTANTENYSVLFYKPVSVGGQLAPPPQRQQSEAPIQAMVEAAVHYESDIKATTMVNDSKLGAKSNETSGAAINARKSQSDTSNYNYIDNRDRAIRHMGRIIIDLIPTVYSTRTIARIIGEDGEADMVNVINDPAQKAFQEQPSLDGKSITKIYNLGVGLYDVSIGTGPTYLTKREAGWDMMTKLVNSSPELMQVAGDLIFGYSDIPGAKAIQKRLYQALDPKFKTDENQQQIPPQLKQAFDEMKQQMAQQTEAMTKMQQIIDQDQIKAKNAVDLKQMDIDSKNQQAAVKAQTEEMKSMSQIIIAQMTNMLAQSKTEMENKFGMLQTLIEGMMAHHTATTIQSMQPEPAAPAGPGQ